MKDKTADKWLTTQQVGEVLGCTDQYVYQLVRQGELDAIQLGRRALRVSERSLNRFIADRTINPQDYYAPEETREKTPPQGPVAAAAGAVKLDPVTKNVLTIILTGKTKGKMNMTFRRT